MNDKHNSNERPWWMVEGAPEPLGDVNQDRLFNEWIRLSGFEPEPGDEPGEEGEKD